MLADPPLHPSYEDRPGAQDRVFAALDDRAYEHQARAWERALADAGAADADVLHLHHLTPLYAAAARVAPDVPVVGHLHGTELLMLEAIEEDPGRWPHGPAWAARMREWAARCERLIVLSGSQVARAERLLGVDPDRCVRIANGFDPETFRPRHVDHRAHWRRHLVEEPHGWAPDEEAGSVRYTEADMAAFGDDRGETPVLLYVGRYTEVKRIGLLIEAYARGAGALRAPRAARAGRRLPGGVGGRAPAGDDPPHRRRGRLPGRLARPRGAAGLPRRVRRRRAPVRPRAVRPGAGRGRRVRAARDRGRRLRPGGDRPRRRDGLARASRRPRRARRRRWWRPSTTRPSGAAAASSRPTTPARATRGRRWRSGSPRSTTRRAGEPRSPLAGLVIAEPRGLIRHSGRGSEAGRTSTAAGWGVLGVHFVTLAHAASASVTKCYT